MNQRTDSGDACTIDDGPNCRTSPVEQYALFVKRIARKVRKIVGSNPERER
ncbi:MULTISPECIES: hypothetical protein [unclassified Haladaptatus]|uniref:hypothetical protein n=1 Tax=unclassified Haladaptatus TaxID=2622732 RepID=UPI00209BEB1E|nr:MULTISPECIES: hypothetical protein [unclassified Haladaptatus]MCO8245815.1 hypothetical protein [Haladaptatus sp. AB643]MCO8256162.1 hypothetical protein [Haladaptatus sp. AB618]